MRKVKSYIEDDKGLQEFIKYKDITGITGKVRLEFRDANTNEIQKEVYTENMMLSDFKKLWFITLGTFADFFPSDGTWVPFYFGSYSHDGNPFKYLLVTSDSSIEDTDEHYIKGRVLGYAKRLETSTGTDGQGGSPNTTEQLFSFSKDFKKLKIHTVIDFPTQCCNGTFQSVIMSFGRGNILNQFRTSYKANTNGSMNIRSYASEVISTGLTPESLSINSSELYATVAISGKLGNLLWFVIQENKSSTYYPVCFISYNLVTEEIKKINFKDLGVYYASSSYIISCFYGEGFLYCRCPYTSKIVKIDISSGTYVINSRGTNAKDETRGSTVIRNGYIYYFDNSAKLIKRYNANDFSYVDTIPYLSWMTADTEFVISYSTLCGVSVSKGTLLPSDSLSTPAQIKNLYVLNDDLTLKEKIPFETSLGVQLGFIDCIPDNDFLTDSFRIQYPCDVSIVNSKICFKTGLRMINGATTRALLPAPVTKTNTQTLKVIYDIEFEIPF